MKFKSISFTGVDGAGKSTIIALLENYIGKQNVIIQYMGSRCYESKIAVKYIENNKSNSILMDVLKIFVFIYEMYYRVWKLRNTSKLIIFDRYVDEKYISLKKNHNIGAKFLLYFYYVFFGILFHKPDVTFYLTCPVEFSLKRKDDIVSDKDKDKLLKNKRLMDNYYINRKNTITIDTSIYTIDETLNKIVCELNQRKILLNYE